MPEPEPGVGPTVGEWRGAVNRAPRAWQDASGDALAPRRFRRCRSRSRNRRTLAGWGTAAMREQTAISAARGTILNAVGAGSSNAQLDCQLFRRMHGEDDVLRQTRGARTRPHAARTHRKSIRASNLLVPVRFAMLTIGRCLALVLLCWLALVPASAQAHQLDRNYCEVHTVAGGLDVIVETPVQTLLAWDEPETPANEAKLLARAPAVASEIMDAVTATSADEPCAVRADAPSVVSIPSGRVLKVPLHFRCPGGDVTLCNRWRLDASPYSEVLCAIDGTAVSFRADHEQYRLATTPTAWRGFARFIGSGTRHVLSGLDHVLFLFTLLLASVVPSERALRAKFLSTIELITGFTFGHSVTLIVASLGFLHVATRLTETFIALSIAVVGLENALRASVRARVVTSTLFGFVHGLGFASGLRELIPHGQAALWSLLGFNVGVELGQMALLCALWPPLIWAASRPWYRKRLLVPISLFVSALALIWTVKRATGLGFWPWLAA